ncbi:RNA-binding protein Musashi-like protein 2 [Trichoplax sp. H2]|nr:RNA-binding protein Musashi-like protein 2 [Trichoplax sp. H2]|eukprot:RDD46935.1 RNA-binding protein Musashi-like protein 2 [Trichoplax sp. H2]
MAESEIYTGTSDPASMSPDNGANKNGAENEEGKMFIGGLNWETTEEGLQKYFSKFGTIVSSTIKNDPITHRSRGFAFVTFANPADVDKVLESGPHQLDNRTVDPKRALPLHKQIQLKGQHRTKKIFIGGLGAEHTESSLKEFFSEFGNILDVEFVTDKLTRKRRGFCFLSFDTEEAVDKACEKQFHVVSGRQVEIKRATPKDQASRGKSAQYSGYPNAQYQQAYPNYYQGYPYAAYPSYTTTAAYVGYQAAYPGNYGSADFQYDSSSRYGPVRAAGYTGSQASGYHPYSR